MAEDQADEAYAVSVGRKEDKKTDLKDEDLNKKQKSDIHQKEAEVIGSAIGDKDKDADKRLGFDRLQRRHPLFMPSYTFDFETPFNTQRSGPSSFGKRTLREYFRSDDNFSPVLKDLGVAEVDSIFEDTPDEPKTSDIDDTVILEKLKHIQRRLEYRSDIDGTLILEKLKHIQRRLEYREHKDGTRILEKLTNIQRELKYRTYTDGTLVLRSLNNIQEGVENMVEQAPNKLTIQKLDNRIDEQLKRDNTSMAASIQTYAQLDDENAQIDDENVGINISDEISTGKILTDEETWQTTLQDMDFEKLKCLAESRPIPNSHILNVACRKLGRRSSILQTICSNVCKTFSSLNPNVELVVPSYKIEHPEQVVFVIFLKKNFPAFKTKKFDTVSRILNEFKDNEGKDVVDMEIQNNLKFSVDDIKKLTNLIEENTDVLFDQHRNLQMISPSFYKSIEYVKRANKNIKKLTCIALYVPIKGYVPLMEEKLPSIIGDVPTDVREGSFEFLSNAQDWHTNLKMGCEIAGYLSKNGTLGPFFKQDGRIYCLTAAHVLCDPKAIPKGEDMFIWGFPEAELGENQLRVYQPNKSRIPLRDVKHFGTINSAFYGRGDKDTPGMEVAVIEITDIGRMPVSGEFPDSNEPMDDNESNIKQIPGVVYESGEVFEKDSISNSYDLDVLMYGSFSGKRQGKIHLTKSSFRKCVFSETGIPYLYSQIVVRPIAGEQSFANRGDSGSLVLGYPRHCTKGNLRAVGIVVGKFSTQETLITPIYAILDELDLPERKFINFNDSEANKPTRDTVYEQHPPEELGSGFNTDEPREFTDLTAVKEDVRDLKKVVQNFKDKFDHLDQKFTKNNEEISKMNNNFENLLEVLKK